MKIIILGAGQVGSSVAYNLAHEAMNDITVVDKDPELLHDLQERLDIRTVIGHASYPSVLEQAGIEDADMILAVTNSDETNMVACQLAYTLYHTPTKIARVRAPEYLAHPEIFLQEVLPVDVLISPEQIVTQYIHKLIDFPGALQVLDFAGGRVQLVAVRVDHGSPMVGQEIRSMRRRLPKIDSRIAALFRNGKPIVPDGDAIIETGDEVFIIAATEHIRKVVAEFRPHDKPAKRIMLAGGGNIGRQLAKVLERNHQVKIIEHNRGNSLKLAETLDHAIVLHGDAADEELLLEENIGDMDVFCAMTNDDEANILSAMLAKQMGAGKVMSLINRSAYVDLVQSGIIDIAISPNLVTIGALLTHVRRGDIVAVHSLRRGAAEAIEAVAHGDRRNSKVVGRMIEEIKLPPEVSIGAIVRRDQVIIAHHDTIVQAEDHIILFLSDKSKIQEVEQLFQVAITFI